MTRKRWIWDATLKDLVPIEEFNREPVAPFVMDDAKPYKSMATGEMIVGRAQHRDHLKRHSLVEIGDAYDKGVPKPKPIQSPPGLKETLARVVYEKLQYK